MSLRAQQPIYLCGAFGGMTADLIEVLRGKEVPGSLTDEYHFDTPDRERAAKEFNVTEIGRNDPIDYDRLVREFQAAGVEGLRNGLEPDENEKLFDSHSVEEIVGLIRKGLNRVARG